MNTDKRPKATWWRFHKKNPLVYKLFEYQVFRAIKEGRKKCSAYQIIEYLRWELPFQTKNEDGFKISNNHIPFYARYFVHLHPEQKEIFNLHQMKHI